MQKIKRLFLLLILSTGIFGCKNSNYQPMVEYSGFALGTTYHIVCDTSGKSMAKSIESLFRNLDHSISDWDSLSLVSQFNRSTGGIWVDTYFIDVLSLSKHIHAETDGAFNPAIYPILQNIKLDEEKADPAKKFSIDSLIRLSKLDDINIATSTDSTRKNQALVSKRHKSNGLYFGGISQGYAVDVLCHLLDANRVENYRVEVGGQVRVKGTNANKSDWKMSLDKATVKGETRIIQSMIPIGKQAISVTGDYQLFYEKDGKQYNTYIDPSTGKMTENTLLNAYVFAPSAAEAHAYATAFMVMGAGKSTQFISRKKDVYAYLISSGFNNDFQTWLSPELEKLIQESTKQ